MRNNRKTIGYKKERVVLSDILPYEVPPFFSNRYFYHFLVQNKVQLLDSKITFKKNSPDYIEKIIKIIFGLNSLDRVFYDHKKDFAYLKINKNTSFKTIPYKFRISHKNKNYRELTVIHPINQLYLISFYDKYKNDMIYHCNKSRFSLRKPNKIASLKYFKDSTFNKKKIKNPEIEIIETTDKEYVGLKTFFSYQKYSNIYKFYESKEFHNAEKKFNKLLKFDISRCFDSIYTHSLPWAITNKKIVKDNLQENENTFGGIFDVLMQKMNYNETNGIVIGPEFSRIFAEIILQKIDADIEKELTAKYRYKVDYDVFRYVDDYFLFYSNDEVKEDILSLYELKLKEFNLFFNESKTEKFEKPIITDITKAKEDIRVLIENTLIFKFFEKDDLPFSGITYHNSEDIITNYKKVLSNTKTSYKDLQNYFLATIFNKTKQLIKKYQGLERKLISKYFKQNKLGISLLAEGLPEEEKDKINKKLEELNSEIELDKNLLDKYHRNIHKKFLEIINLTFFVYTVLPRVSYSIKVCHILFRIIDFIKNQEKTKLLLSQKPNQSYILDKIEIGLSFDNKHSIFKSIFDGIKVVLKKNRETVYSEIETLYLLAIINELGENYELSERTLIEHFDIDEANYMSYFLIVSLLHHIKRKAKYNTIRELLRDKIRNKFSKFESRKAEDTLLLIDVLTCPYIGSTDNEVIEFRKEILNTIKFFKTNEPNVNKYAFINSISLKEPNWFSKWESSDLGKELNTKRGHNVY